MEVYSLRCSACDNEILFKQDLQVSQDVPVLLVFLDLWDQKVRLKVMMKLYCIVNGIIIL